MIVSRPPAAREVTIFVSNEMGDPFIEIKLRQHRLEGEHKTNTGEMQMSV